MIDCDSTVLAKLEFYGIAGKFLNLIECNLEVRYQKVSILCNIHSDNISSDWKKITHCVPRGSILDLLFLVCINDLPKALIQNALLVRLADDSSIVDSDSNIVDLQLKMNVVFDQLNNWFNVFLSSLNLKKKSFIHLEQRTLMR